MSGFRTIYTTEPLPTGVPVLIYYLLGESVMVVHEPSLLEDPRGVLDYANAHRETNVEGRLLEQRIRLAG